MKNKPEWLDRYVLELPYHTLCLNRKEFHSELERLGINENNWPSFLATATAHATTHSLTNQTGELCCVVTLFTKDATPIQIAALLVHEAVHIWQEYARRFGGSEENEFEAYIIQRISQNLMYEYSRRKCK